MKPPHWFTQKYVEFCWSILLIHIPICLGDCIFPEFLYRSKHGATNRKWTSETYFRPGADSWKSQQDILMEASSYTITRQTRIDCYENGKLATCAQKETLYKRICQRKEYQDVYRVAHYQNAKPMFACVKFVRRSHSLVQIFETPLSPQNDAALCERERLQRLEWPWITSTQEEVSYCPIHGGFDFRTYQGDLKGGELCKTHWRPSRLETECILGTGMEFIFPETNCSTFTSRTSSTILNCWGSWVEEDYMFIVASEVRKAPQFVLRFPNYKHFHQNDLSVTPTRETQRPFSVHLYHSPVAPLDMVGIPRAEIEGEEPIMHHELRMRRSDTGLCYDESDKCEEYAKEGRCTSSGLHQFANYCKRSCKLCNKGPTIMSECLFPMDLQGQWVLFEPDRTESVSVSRGQIRFSRLGKFICKSKHWAKDEYKVLSVFNNGCRPRYSCMHISQETDGLMRYRLSRSSRTDESFGLCHFHNDPPPLLGRVRSALNKVLLPTSMIHFNTCALKGSMATTVTMADGTTCRGHVDDINRSTCQGGQELHVTRDCEGSDSNKHVFRCNAYAELGDTHGVLITSVKSPYNEVTYSCWIIRQYPERMSFKPWRDAYLLPRAQCGNEEDFYMAKFARPRISLIMDTDVISQPCQLPTVQPTVGMSLSPILQHTPSLSIIQAATESPPPLPAYRTNTKQSSSNVRSNKKTQRTSTMDNEARAVTSSRSLIMMITCVTWLLQSSHR